MVFGAFIDKTLFVCIETFGLLEEEFSMTDIKPFYITILYVIWQLSKQSMNGNSH